jgi:hypothetical protein
MASPYIKIYLEEVATGDINIVTVGTNSLLNGSDYYEFAVNDIQFEIYYDGADWTFESLDGNSFAQANSSSPEQVSTGAWTNTGGNIYDVSDIDLAKPLFPVGFSNTVTDLQECLANKGTNFLYKIKGGVKCSTIELSKLQLIYYLLQKYDQQTGDALECIFNGKSIEGYDFTDSINFTPLNTNTYLETFLNYIKKSCRDCIITSPPDAVAPTTPIRRVEGEDGTTIITMEDNSDILYE